MTLSVTLVWVLACLLWASTFLFIRLGLRDIAPFTFAWVRLAIAAVILGALAIRRPDWRSLGRRDVVHIAGSGLVLLGVNYGFLFWGAQFVPSGLVAILQAGTPVLALAFGAALGSERVTPRKIFAVIVGIVGVATIFGAEARASGPAAVLGSLAVFGGSVCVALAYVWMKTYGRHLHPTSVTTIQALAGLVPLACLGLAIEGAPTPSTWSAAAWGALLYLAIVASVVAFWLNYWLLRRMDASAMLMMGVAEVPIAVALGAVVFGERLPAGTLVGATCVLAAVIAGLTGSKAAA